MLPKVVAKDVFNDFISGLIGRSRVIGPRLKETAKGREFFEFAQLNSVDELRMDYPITVQSPKEFFLPPEESLLKYQPGDLASAEPVVHAPETVLVGVHPCDIYATWLLDAVFEADYEDPHYLHRRRKSVIIGLDCVKPCDDKSFCKDMGSIDCESGYDLLLTDIGDKYFIDIGTERGQELLIDCAQATTAGSEDYAARQDFLNQKQANFHKRIPVDMRYMPEILAEAYDNLVWQATARRCFSCGSCNLVCPTCYCFDVFDDVALNLKEGERKRTWDACMLRPFAEVAGGENFRPDPEERLRHRVYRKGKFLREQFGKSGCVGCGRCERSCVANISIREIFTQLSGSL